MDPNRWRKWLKWTCQFSLLALGAYISVASNEVETCFYGVLPFDGMTAVPASAVITFRSPVPLPRDLPAFNEYAAGLYLLPEGTRVDTDVEVDLQQDEIRLIPRNPLLQNREYLATGVNLIVLSTPNHAVDDETPNFLEPVTAQFQTASRPGVLAMSVGNSDEGGQTVTLVFSEDMEEETLNPQTVRVIAETADPDQEDSTLEIVQEIQEIRPYSLYVSSTGEYKEIPHIYQIETVGDYPEISYVVLEPSVRSRAGTGLIDSPADTNATDGLMVRPYWPEELNYKIDSFLGNPSCDY